MAVLETSNSWNDKLRKSSRPEQLLSLRLSLVHDELNKEIEKDGTEGVFHTWCVDHGYKDGCDSACWTAAKKEGGKWSQRAGTAKAFCESKK